MREWRERQLRWEFLHDRSLALLSPEQRERVERGEVRSPEQKWIAELLTKFVNLGIRASC